MRFWHKHPWALRGLALLAAALLAWLPALWSPAGVRGLEDRAGDLVWRLGADASPERRLVLVDIDERSLQEVGPWPWPRATLARLIAGVHASGAAAQALDIVLAEPREGDELLAAEVRRSAPVLAQLFSLDPQVRPQVGAVVDGSAGCAAGVPQSQGHYGLSATLAAAQPRSGHITPRVDGDGVVRRLPARICHEGRTQVALSLALLDQLLASPGTGWTEAAPAAGWLQPARVLQHPALPDLRLPLDARDDLRVPYRRARDAFVSVAAADVLAARPQALQALRGAVVLVGSSAFGTGDTVATPLAAVSSGLEVHAQMLAGLLDGRLPYTPAAASLLQALAVLLVAALLLGVGSSAQGAPAKRLPLAGALLAAVLLGACVYALRAGGLWLPWLVPVLFSLLAAFGLATVEHALARAQRQRLSAHLGAYLPSTVAERLMATEPSGELQFETRSVSVLEASVRNFASLAGAATAEELAAILHAYCCLVVEVVERHGGVVEHVLGENVRALFNANGDCPDHAWRAAQAAAALLRESAALFASRRPVREDQAVQPLALGIGLETGPVVMGSYGPSRRRAHAALGDAVLYAARLQQMTADLAVPVLLGPSIAAALAPQQVQPLGEFLPEGLGRQVALATLAGWSELVEVDLAWAASATRPMRGDDSVPGLPARSLRGAADAAGPLPGRRSRA